MEPEEEGGGASEVVEEDEVVVGEVGDEAKEAFEGPPS